MCTHIPGLSHLCQARQQKSCGGKQRTMNKKQTYLIRVSKDVSSRTPIQFSIRDYLEVAAATQRSFRPGAKRITPQAMERGPGSLLKEPS